MPHADLLGKSHFVASALRYILVLWMKSCSKEA